MCVCVCVCVNSSNNGAIGPLHSNPLKFVDYFTYLISHISSTENDINIRIGKAQTAINNLNTLGKSNTSDKIKQNFS